MLKARPLAPVSQGVNTNETKRCALVNTEIIRKQNSLIASMEKTVVVWMENQTSQNIPSSQNPRARPHLSLILGRLRAVKLADVGS